MAVTIKRKVLCGALRLGDSPEEMAEVERLLTYSKTAVERHVAICPDEVHNESVCRLAGYLFDQPNAGRGLAYANAMRNSGAASILAPYRVHRAGII